MNKKSFLFAIALLLTTSVKAASTIVYTQNFENATVNGTMIGDTEAANYGGGAAWNFDIDTNNALSGAKSAYLNVSSAGSDWWTLQYKIDSKFSVIKGARYKVTCKIKSSVNTTIRFNVFATADFTQNITLNAGSTQSICIITTAMDNSGSNPNFQFAFGNPSIPGEFWIDDIAIEQLDYLTDGVVYSEDFESSSVNGNFIGDTEAANYGGGAVWSFGLETSNPISGLKSAYFNIINNGSDWGTLQYKVDSKFPVIQGIRYKVSFKIKSSVATTIMYKVLNTANFSQHVVLTGAGVQSVSIITDPMNISASTANFQFSLGSPAIPCELWIDDLVIEKLSPFITIDLNSPLLLSTLFDSSNCDIVVSNNGDLTVDASKIINSVTVTPGGKLTINSGQNLTTGSISLQSSSSGTATFVDKTNSGGLTVNGTSTAQQYLGSARNWYVSSPVSSASAPASNIAYYYEYVEAGDNDPTGQPGSSTVFWKGLATGSPMAVGKGYIAKANAGTTISFNGTPNNGSITTVFDLTRNESAGKGFNLAGNPYPSYIDWTDVATANPNLDNTYYYRTKNTLDGYTFVTYNGAGSGSYVVGNGTANTTITRFIPPTQAFWVRVKSGTSATKMNFNNGMREHRDDNGNLMKAPRQDTRTSVRLQLHNGTQSDELLIYQDAGASNEYDSYDSPKMMNNNTSIPDLYSIAGDEQVVINGLNTITENMEIPLGFSLKSAAALKIKATELSNLPEGMNVYLLDKSANTQTQLTTETEYSFTTTAATTNNESRFSLVFKSPGITTVDNASEFSQQTVFVNAQNKLVIIAPENTSYAIYTMVGELVKAGKVTDNAERINSVSQGVYLVKVNNQTMKVIIR